jgi:hypothetical protein
VHSGLHHEDKYARPTAESFCLRGRHTVFTPVSDGGFLPRATGLDTELILDGLEPSLPGCKPGVVAAEPRDRRQSNSLKWTHRESHPDPRHARPASSSWTMSPRVIPRRISHGTGNLSDSGSRGTRTHNGVSSVPAFEAGS